MPSGLGVAQEQHTGKAAERNRAHLTESRWHGEHDHGRCHRERRPFPVGCERTHHAQHRLRDDRDGSDLEAV